MNAHYRPHNREAPCHRWEVPNDKQQGGVRSLDNYDILGDGVADLLVGRDDGMIQVFGYDDTDEPVLRFSQVHDLNHVMMMKFFGNIHF